MTTLLLFYASVMVSVVHAADINFCSGSRMQLQIDTSQKLNHLSIDGSDVAINVVPATAGGSATSSNVISDDVLSRSKRLANDVKHNYGTSCTCRVRPIMPASELMTVDVELQTDHAPDCPKTLTVSPPGVSFGCLDQLTQTTLSGADEMTLTLTTFITSTAPVMYTNSYLLKIHPYDGVFTLNVACDLPQPISVSTTSTAPSSTSTTSTTQTFTSTTSTSSSTSTTSTTSSVAVSNTTDKDTNSTQIVAVITPSIDPTFIVVGVVVGLCILAVVLIMCVVLAFGRREMKQSEAQLPQTTTGRLYRRVHNTATRVWKSVRHKRPLPDIPSPTRETPSQCHDRGTPNLLTNMYDSIRSQPNGNVQNLQHSAFSNNPQIHGHVFYVGDMEKVNTSIEDQPTLRHHNVLIELPSGPYLNPVSDNHPILRRDSGYMEPADHRRSQDGDSPTVLRSSSVETDDSGYANVQRDSKRSTGSDVINLDNAHEECGYLPMNGVSVKQQVLSDGQRVNGHVHKSTEGNASNSLSVKTPVFPQESHGYIKMGDV